ncbi:MAG: hypothetical protein U0892_13350 [Pirellulales bacterium]
MEGTTTIRYPKRSIDFLPSCCPSFPTTRDIEVIIEGTTETETPEASRLMEPARVLEMSRLARRIPISDEVRRFAIHTIMASHPDHELAGPMTKQFVRYGSSPRGAQAVILAAKIHAILDSRYHVATDDIRAVAADCLRHRILLNFEGQAEDIKTDAVVQNILDHISKAS